MMNLLLGFLRKILVKRKVLEIYPKGEDQELGLSDDLALTVISSTAQDR